MPGMYEAQKRHTVGRHFKGIKYAVETYCSVMVFYRTDQTLICLLITVMAGAEVQEILSPDCKQFLYMGTLPRGLEEKPFKKICQFYEGHPRFVTLYDTFNHIPVYSAYTFKRSDGSKKVDVPWMYEPQVGAEYPLKKKNALFLMFRIGNFGKILWKSVLFCNQFTV